MKFYECKICGNIVASVKESGVPVVCCGENMEELKPNTVDAAFEKHIPVFMIDGDKIYVTVGDMEHPMTAAHHIEWIAIETTNGNQRKILDPEGSPTSCFALCKGDKVKAVYAYCNLHGLWRKDN
ncbi:MAG: desulfoferrodoxin [Clostridia bacterium]|nr:desulfoferrodoxin [Clostridia bacterium]